MGRYDVTSNRKILYRRQGCLWVPPVRDRGRAGCSCEQVPANKSRGDWAQGVKRGDGRAKNCCGDRRGRVGWTALRAGDGNVSSNVSVGTVIVAQMGGVGGVWGVQGRSNSSTLVGGAQRAVVAVA